MLYFLHKSYEVKQKNSFDLGYSYKDSQIVLFFYFVVLAQSCQVQFQLKCFIVFLISFLYNSVW